MSEVRQAVTLADLNTEALRTMRDALVFLGTAIRGEGAQTLSMAQRGELAHAVIEHVGPALLGLVAEEDEEGSENSAHWG